MGYADMVCKAILFFCKCRHRFGIPTRLQEAEEEEDGELESPRRGGTVEEEQEGEEEDDEEEEGTIRVARNLL